MQQNDSDWDNVDALGMALIRIKDMRKPSQKQKDEKNIYTLPSWVRDYQGNWVCEKV